MKRGTHRHAKMYELSRVLKREIPACMGYLELLWQATGDYSPQGNIGKFPDDWIEASCMWKGKRGALIAALVASRWLDTDEQHRLVVHDWSEHAEDFVRRKLERSKLTFITNQRDSGKVVAFPPSVTEETTTRDGENPVTDDPRARAVPSPAQAKPLLQPLPRPSPPEPRGDPQPSRLTPKPIEGPPTMKDLLNGKSMGGPPRARAPMSSQRAQILDGVFSLLSAYQIEAKTQAWGTFGIGLCGAFYEKSGENMPRLRIFLKESQKRTQGNGWEWLLAIADDMRALFAPADAETPAHVDGSP